MNTRREQLRAAKQKQRLKEREAGLGLYQIKLPIRFLGKLRTGMLNAGFVQKFYEFLDQEIIKIDEYPDLALLCWNRKAEYMTRREAFELYEANWRFLDESSLQTHERTLVSELTWDFGRGVLNA